uniref:CARD domain-containing protein n=1 Tax=Maylandia zebra TaxID=106582 RepID=A0A3P9DSK6_9CICH
MNRTDLVQKLPESSSASRGKTNMHECKLCHFVDKHRVQLIQRVSNIAPILDELLDNEVINQETYTRIRALSTTQEKMRELYSGPLKASAACKDIYEIFYDILLANEKFLVKELSEKD